VRSDASWKASRSPLATAATPLLLGHGGGEEIVGLVSRRLGIGEAARINELRQDIELLDQFAVELAAALIPGEQLLPVGRAAERVPANQDGSRPLAVVEPDQEIGEADDGTAALVAGAPDRFRQRVIGAMREGVAVDDEERPGHALLLRVTE
jgi:hypothetical protein